VAVLLYGGCEEQPLQSECAGQEILDALLLKKIWHSVTCNKPQQFDYKRHSVKSTVFLHLVKSIIFLFFFLLFFFFVERQLQVLFCTHISSGKCWLLPWSIKQHIRLGPCQGLSCHCTENILKLSEQTRFLFWLSSTAFFSRHVITQEKNYPRALWEANNRKEKADLDPQTVPDVKDAGSAVSFLTWNKSSHTVS